MSARYRCAAHAQSRGEPRLGTASHVARWILLEQPGPWGRDAVLESRLPAAVATELTSAAVDLNARLVLIRRPGGGASARPRCFLASSDVTRLEELVLDDVTDILDVDLSPLRAGEAVGGAPVAHPLHLVCTNGRHDACCAEYGQPLVRALEAEMGERVWECSHIGGDRFAGNLVCFPHGLYFGHLDADSGPAVARRYEAGVIDLHHYRGRSCHPFVVQAAESFLRAERGLRHVDDLDYLGRKPIADDAFRVAFEGRDGRRWAVEVRVCRDGEERLLTCQATVAACPPRYELLAVTGVAASAFSSRPRR